jgi:hypothetical protein
VNILHCQSSRYSQVLFYREDILHEQTKGSDTWQEVYQMIGSAKNNVFGMPQASLMHLQTDQMPPNPAYTMMLNQSTMSCRMMENQWLDTEVSIQAFRKWTGVCEL